VVLRCPDGTNCLDTQTCCRLSTGGYGCCPYTQATCCAVGLDTCCPRASPCCLGDCCPTNNVCCNNVNVPGCCAGAYPVCCNNAYCCASGYHCCGYQECCRNSQNHGDVIGPPAVTMCALLLLQALSLVLKQVS